MKAKRLLPLLGAAAITAALAGTAQASTLSSQPVNGVEEAGYQAGDPSAVAPWHFRYVQAQVVLPDISGNVDKKSFAGYGVSVRLTNVAESAVLGVSAAPGSDYNPAFNLEAAPTGGTIGGCVDTNSKAIPAGHTIVLALFFDGAKLSASVTDKTDPTLSFAYTCADPTPGDLFDQAQIGTEFGVTPWSSTAPTPPASTTSRLATFTNTVVTNRTGIRGSIGSARWPVQALWLKTAIPGATWGTGKAAPDNVIRTGRNFSVSLLGGSL